MNNHHIYIDSSYYANPSNFSYPLTSVKNIKKIVLSSYEIPNSFYIINNSNNQLYFEDNVPNIYFITVPPGNYDSPTLAVTLNDLMAAKLANSTVTYSDTTYKLTFANTVTKFNLLAWSSISSVIGLTSNSGLTNSFTCQNILDLQCNYIFLKTNLFQDGIKRAYIQDISKGYIRIQNNMNMGNYLIFHDDNEKICFDYSDRQTFSEITFQLLDKKENEIDLNGLGFSLELILYN